MMFWALNFKMMLESDSLFIFYQCGCDTVFSGVAAVVTFSLFHFVFLFFYNESSQAAY